MCIRVEVDDEEKPPSHHLGLCTSATMAPYINAHESAIDNDVDINRLKAQVGISEVEVESTAKPPVPDDYLYDFKYNHPLPTSDVLGIEISNDCDAQKEAESIMACLSDAMGKGDAQGFADMFLEHGEFLFMRKL